MLIRYNRILVAVSFYCTNQPDDDLLTCRLRASIIYKAPALELLISEIEVPLELHSDSINSSRAQPQAFALPAHAAAVRHLLLFHFNKVSTGIKRLLCDKEPLAAFETVFLTSDWHHLCDKFVLSPQLDFTPTLNVAFHVKAGGP